MFTTQKSHVQHTSVHHIRKNIIKPEVRVRVKEYTLSLGLMKAKNKPSTNPQTQKKTKKQTIVKNQSQYIMIQISL